MGHRRRHAERALPARPHEAIVDRGRPDRRRRLPGERRNPPRQRARFHVRRRAEYVPPLPGRRRAVRVEARRIEITRVSLLSFAEWLGNTPGSIALHESQYMYAIVESVHVWALAVFVG